MMKRHLQIGCVIALLILLGACDQEKKDWQKTIAADTPEAYREFIAKYPESKQTLMAKYHVERMTYKNAMRLKNLTSFQDYLREFPEGQWASNAGAQINSILRFQLRQMPDDKLTAARVKFATDYGEFTVRVFPDKAPVTSRNFLALALAGFYDGLIFFYAVPGQLVQTGDPRGDGMGGPGYFISFEETGLKHARGALSMYRTPQDPNTAGSQFAVCLQDLPQRDGKFAVFGEVVEGLETLDRISELNISGKDESISAAAVPPARIERVAVEGVEIK